jgi:FkbM family methyltransferase
MDIDFLEIGTSDVDTIVQVCDDNATGFSVEPIKYYLDKLPDKKNVKKINKAITGDKVKNSKIKIYYIPFDIIVSEKLPLFLRGCNRVNDYHPLHLELNLKQFVKIEEVDLINIGDFLLENDIRKIECLKIDTEGYEINILKGLFDYLSNLSDDYHPKKIIFETNTSGKEFINEVYDIINLFYKIRYKLVSSNIVPRQCTDTILKKI